MVLHSILEVGGGDGPSDYAGPFEAVLFCWFCFGFDGGVLFLRVGFGFGSASGVYGFFVATLVRSWFICGVKLVGLILLVLMGSLMVCVKRMGLVR